MTDAKSRYYAHGTSNYAETDHPFLNGNTVPDIRDRETGEQIAHVVTPETAGLIAIALNIYERVDFPALREALEQIDATIAGNPRALDWGALRAAIASITEPKEG